MLNEKSAVCDGIFLPLHIHTIHNMMQRNVVIELPNG
jgi:hypothetical protein